MLPFEPQVILESLKKTRRLVSVEDVCEDDCVGVKVLAECEKNGVLLSGSCLLNVRNGIVPHGSVSILRKKYELDGESVAARVRAMCAGNGGAK